MDERSRNLLRLPSEIRTSHVRAPGVPGSSVIIGGPPCASARTDALRR